MLSINFNPTLFGLQNKLNTYNNVLNTSLERLSTGLRINSVGDDTAGYYVSQGLNSQIRGLKEAQNNIAMGSSLLSSAEDVMGNMTDMLNRLNDLALQGANTAMTETERIALTNEANALIEEIKKQNADTTFNGMNVFGSVSSTVTSNIGVSNVSSDVVPAGYTAIYTAEDLNKVRNNLSGKYILMADIDLSSIDNWEPIGTYVSGQDKAFGGTFDGNGHVIKNITVDRPYANYGGLFGCTKSGSEIKNLGLENVDIKGNINVGGLVGESNSTVSNCYVIGNIEGKDSNIGGLIGLSKGTIDKCYANINVVGAKNEVGGLVGTSRGNITNCYATGKISGTDDVAGIAGYLNSGNSITNCYAACNISGNSSVGGLVGGLNGRLANSYSSSVITGNKKLGLICGAITSANITNVWADKKDSNLNAIGSKSGSTVTNSDAVEHSEFTSHEFWDSKNFDSAVWEMSCSIPPVLKGVGTNNINWYFGRGDNETRLQTGGNSDPAANSMTVNTGLDLGAMAMDFSTVEGCLDASRCALAAIDAVAKRSSTVGASQNRLESASSANSIMVENLTAAHSNIVNAVTAEESTNYAKAQIMSYTASSLITQARSFQANLLMNLINALG